MNLYPALECVKKQWEICSHRFSPWFGPVLKCRHCGATTMLSMDPKESKPIFPPAPYQEDK